MSSKAVSRIMLALLLIGMSTLVFKIQPVKGEPIDRVGSVVLEFDFPSPVVTEDSLYDSVTMPGLPQYGAPGKPILPFRMVKALIPQGKDVQSVEVTAGNRIVLEGRFSVEYGKTPIPISSDATVKDLPDQEIYSSANPFPGVLFSQMLEQHLSGYKILMLKLHPVQYVPKAGDLSYFETMIVTVNTMVSSNVSPLFRNLQQDRALVLDIVDNPSEVESYTDTTKLIQSTTLVDPSDSYDYVIITNNVLKSSFQPLIDWKIQKGFNATIVLVEDIMDDPDYHCDGLFGDGCSTAKFNDTQAHIRNFIKDAYQNWGTEYVLLGGDDEIIPARGVYAYYAPSTDYNIPCDMYYGALDGSWDNDNDTIFGEGFFDEEADFFAEVYIGRATVDTPEEATIFVNKTLWYEQASDDSYFKKALMIGETADFMTEGGNGKDLVTDMLSQYTTIRLYDRDRTFSRSAVIKELNIGTHIVNHEGHARPTNVMGLNRTDIRNLNNTEYFIAYSVGCYSAAFDEATSGSDEAIAECFIFNPHGAFAYIGNSRYGWYIRGSTSGPSDRYERSFFNVVRKGIRNVGKALQLSKEYLFDEYVHRWTYFTLNLLGDPEVEIVTDITAPTAHFETRTDLLTPRCYWKTVSLRGTAKRGTAVGATFSNYTIEFGLGTNPTFWSSTGVNLTNNGESEVVNGTLAMWNTSLVDDGTYTLRLTVSDIDGNIGEDWAVIVVDNTLTVHNIDTGLGYPTIQEAINAHETWDGHTILVDEGIYYEPVFVKKALSLVGENRSFTIVDGNKTGNAFNIISGNVNITGFTIKGGAKPAGIHLYTASHCNITKNDITNNTSGSYLDFLSSNNIIQGNNITNNRSGIDLDGWSSDNTIQGNNIENNEYGIWLYESSNNYIYHNNFVNNTNQVYDFSQASINVWDNGYPSGGNYWSDYTGDDVKSGPLQDQSGSDGIGDTAYVIYAKNTDHYPLMYPWGSPPPPSYTLTIYSSPTGVTFTVDGVSRTTTWSGTYSENTSVSLIMPEIHTVGDARYYWNQWSDGNTSRSRTVTMTTNITLTAYYTGPYYELTVTSLPITGIPFTINGVPETTPYTEWLPEDSYTLKMPETHNGYVWFHWLEDGDTSRTKAITLSGTTWTGVYVPAPPPPAVGGEMILVKVHKPPRDGFSNPLGLAIACIMILSVISVAYVKHREKKQI